MPAFSPTGIFLFLSLRSLRNAAARRLKRLKEPKYLIAFLFGLAYFWFLFIRPRVQTRSRTAREFSPETLLLLLLAASAALAFLFLFLWLFRKGKPALGLTEAEAQFLFPAPLSSRAVLHYALLRPQAGLLFSALVFAFIFGRRDPMDAVRSFVASWTALSTLRFHALGMSLWKGAWREKPLARRLAVRIGTSAVLVALLAFLLLWLVDAVRIVIEELSGQEDWSALSRARWAGAAAIFLAPFRAVVAPLFSPDLASLLNRLPLALLILALHYVWVVRANVRYEEATIEHAGRRARRKASWKSGRLQTAPSAAGRNIVPFPLSAAGRPEAAIVWKNLLAWQRVRLKRFAAGTILISALLFILSAKLLSPDEKGRSIGLIAALCVTAFALSGATLQPMGLRNDFRGDIENMDQLKVWPLSGPRLVAGEIAAPWIVSMMYLWGGLALALALCAGSLLRAPAAASGIEFLESLQTLGLPLLLPSILSLALFLPGICAALLVAQNGALLLFPGWFRPLQRRSAGVEAIGMRLLSFGMFALVLLVAAIPAAAIGGLVFLLLKGVLGYWTIPVAALFASLPLWAEVVLGIGLLASLFERLDPSRELGD